MAAIYALGTALALFLLVPAVNAEISDPTDNLLCNVSDRYGTTDWGTVSGNDGPGVWFVIGPLPGSTGSFGKTIQAGCTLDYIGQFLQK